MDLIISLFISLMGILAITSPRIFTKAQGDEFGPARAKLKKGGWLLMVSGFLLLMVALSRYL